MNENFLDAAYQLIYNNERFVNGKEPSDFKEWEYSKPSHIHMIRVMPAELKILIMHQVRLHHPYRNCT